VENRFWKNLCDVLNVPEYGQLQYDDNHRKEILDFFRKAFKKKTLDQWVKELRDKDVCWGRIQDLEEVLNDPLFLARDMVSEIKDDKGKPVTMLGIPVKLSDTPGSIRSTAVGFGGSTRRILAELGYTKGEIKELIEKGVV
jgi:crotonobetainyl-CoA:carnitine CoA-transferase CaiB-like acyl-CoA transferase